MKKLPLSILTPLVLAAILLAGCGAGAGAGPATPTPYPTPVRTTYTVQKGDIVINADLAGQVKPIALSTVYFQMSGTVDQVYVESNELVKKGQLLADLVELKDLQAKAGETSRTIQRAQINLEIAQEELAKLKAQGASPYDIKIQELQVQLAQLNLDEVLSQNGLTDATDYLNAVDAQLNNAKVFAPADGLIISGVNSGRSVSTTTPAFIIGDPNQLEVEADIDPAKATSQLQQMFEGMPVNVTLDAKPDQKFSGKIRQLPSPYGTGSSDDNSVHVVLDQAPSPDTYQAGDKVTVHIELANKVGVLWLPPIAIHQIGGRTFVIVEGASGPQRIDVEIGLQTQDKVEILNGLKVGQIVIGQ